MTKILKKKPYNKKKIFKFIINKYNNKKEFT